MTTPTTQADDDPHQGCIRLTDGTHICNTSAGLDELTRAQQRSTVFVLQWLKDHAGRFSAFEVTSSKDIANTMDRLGRQKLITYQKPPPAYPWCKVTLTAEGEALLKKPEGEHA